MSPYRPAYHLERRAALAHPRGRAAVAWTVASFDDAARRLGDGTERGWWLAAVRLRGLAGGEWDRVVAEAVRVPVPGPYAAQWAAIAAEARGETNPERLAAK